MGQGGASDRQYRILKERLRLGNIYSFGGGGTALGDEAFETDDAQEDGRLAPTPRAPARDYSFCSYLGPSSRTCILRSPLCGAIQCVSLNIE